MDVPQSDGGITEQWKQVNVTIRTRAGYKPMSWDQIYKLVRTSYPGWSIEGGLQQSPSTKLWWVTISRVVMEVKPAPVIVPVYYDRLGKCWRRRDTGAPALRTRCIEPN